MSIANGDLRVSNSDVHVEFHVVSLGICNMQKFSLRNNGDILLALLLLAIFFPIALWQQMTWFNSVTGLAGLLSAL